VETIVSEVVQLTIFFSFVCAVGGLALGTLMSNRQPIEGVNLILSLLGAAAAIICALILAFAPLAPVGLEVGGVMLGLSLFLTFVGVGLFINPYKQT